LGCCRPQRKGMLAKLPEICMCRRFIGIRPVMHSKKAGGAPAHLAPDQPAIGMEVKGHEAWLFMSMFSSRVRI
jgi:hypothetical protein